MSVQATTCVLGHRSGGAWVISPIPTPNAGARVVLLVLANFADEAGEAYPGLETIAAAADMSVDQVRRHLRSLERSEIVEIVQNGAPDRRIPTNRRPNLYRILGVASTRGQGDSDPAPTRLRPRVDAAQTPRPRGPNHQEPPRTKPRARAQAAESDRQTRRDYLDVDDTSDLLDAARAARQDPDLSETAAAELKKARRHLGVVS